MRLLLVGALVFSASIARGSEAADPTLDRLAKVETFAFGGTGYAGVVSQGEKDFRSILSRPTAMADFEKLYETGNWQARPYALVGIRLLDPRKYKELSKSLRTSSEEVTTMHGCIVLREQIADVVTQIERGDYR